MTKKELLKKLSDPATRVNGRYLGVTREDIINDVKRQLAEQNLPEGMMTIDDDKITFEDSTQFILLPKAPMKVHNAKVEVRSKDIVVINKDIEHRNYIQHKYLTVIDDNTFTSLSYEYKIVKAQPMYEVVYIETCGTKYIKETMTGAKLEELMGGLDYEVHSWKEIKDND